MNNQNLNIINFKCIETLLKNIKDNKKGFKKVKVLNKFNLIYQLLDNLKNEDKFYLYEIIRKLLRDTDCLEIEHINNNSDLIYIGLLGLFIELFTPFNIEISSINNDDPENEPFLQIDEENNMFYFTFFKDRLEFAHGNFDNFFTIKKESGYKENIIPFLSEAGFPESIIYSFNSLVEIYKIIH